MGKDQDRRPRRVAGGRQAGISGHGGARGVWRWGNADFRYNTVITEETCAGRYSGIGFGLHNDIVAPYLLALATEEQKRRWFPNFCTGELTTAIAMTEPGTGSDLQGITTRAVKHGDHYVLNGSKTFITNGINSDLVIVVAQTDPEKGAQGFSLLVVERGMAGFERGRQLDKIGLTPRTPPSCPSPTWRFQPKTCSARRGWGSST